jgi:hypothetical protein
MRIFHAAILVSLATVFGIPLPARAAEHNATISREDADALGEAMRDAGERAVNDGYDRDQPMDGIHVDHVDPDTGHFDGHMEPHEFGGENNDGSDDE